MTDYVGKINLAMHAQASPCIMGDVASSTSLLGRSMRACAGEGEDSMHTALVLACRQGDGHARTHMHIRPGPSVYWVIPMCGSARCCGVKLNTCCTCSSAAYAVDVACGASHVHCGHMEPCGAVRTVSALP